MNMIANMNMNMSMDCIPREMLLLDSVRLLVEIEWTRLLEQMRCDAMRSATPAFVFVTIHSESSSTAAGSAAPIATTARPFLILTSPSTLNAQRSTLNAHLNPTQPFSSSSYVCLTAPPSLARSHYRSVVESAYKDDDDDYLLHHNDGP